MGSGDLRQLRARGTAQILQAIGGWAVRAQGAQVGRPGPTVILACHLAAVTGTAAEASCVQVSHFEAWKVAFPDKHHEAISRPQEIAVRTGAQAPDINVQVHRACTCRRTQDVLTFQHVSLGSVVASTLGNALLTKVSAGALDPESASGQEEAIVGPLSAASYSQPCTLPPACSQNTGLVWGSGTGRGVPVPLSRPPCPGLKVEDSTASHSRPLEKGGCGTFAGQPSFPRTSHHCPHHPQVHGPGLATIGQQG